MDTFAHALWGRVAARAANRKLKSPVGAWWVPLWAMFPDLFAFGPDVIAALWVRFVSGDPQTIAAARGHGWRHVPGGLHLAGDLYPLSHSLVIFALVYGLLWLLLRRPVWAVLGWPLHILMDIPTHSLRFYATPFLWPVSSYRFDGIRWGQQWFMILNYSLLAAAFLALWITGWLRRRRRSREDAAEAEAVGARGSR